MYDTQRLQIYALSNSREENYHMLQESLERLELPYTVVRIFPFVDKVVDVQQIPEGPYEVDKLPDLEVLEDVFVFGAVKLARIVAQKSWKPGSLLNLIMTIH